MNQWIMDEDNPENQINVAHTTWPRFFASFSEMDDGSYGAHQIDWIDRVHAAYEHDFLDAAIRLIGKR